MNCHASLAMTLLRFFIFIKERKLMNQPHFETKTLDANTALEQFCRGFEAFKAENDTRLKQLENQKSVDVLMDEKLSRIDQAMDEAKSRLDRLALDKSRPVIGADTRADPAQQEHKSAFESYIRSGEAGGLKRLEEKALSFGSGPDGGYLAPSQVEKEVLRRMSVVSPLRAISTTRQISSSTYRRAFSTNGMSAGWASEVAARPQTDTTTLAALDFPTMELYAMPAATQGLLDDAIVDIGQWIADEVQNAFAEQEGAAFISGNGTDRPKGFLTYPTIANASWTWGNIGMLATGTAGAFPAGNPSDVLVDLIYALKAGYRQNASFVMNRKTQSMIRKFKDSTGNYLWQPPTGVGQAATLMNFPLVEAENMPDVANNSLAIAFGDFRRGYLVVDRAGVRVLRDPYSAKPYVLFYTTKRVGGGVQDFDAIKLLKFGV